MNKKRRGWLSNLWNKLALDTIPIIFNDSKFINCPRPSVERHREIKAKAQQLSGEHLHTTISYYKELLAEDDKRRVDLDSKASTLSGFVGIVTSVIVGFAPFLIGGSSLSSLSRWVISVLYLAIGASSIFSIILANRSIEVGKEKYMLPDPLDMLEINEVNPEKVYQQLAGDLLRSYEHNLALINDKSIYVRMAQDWLRNTMFGLLVLMCAFIAISNIGTQAQSEPTQIMIVTPTPSYVPTTTPFSTPQVSPAITPTP